MDLRETVDALIDGDFESDIFSAEHVGTGAAEHDGEHTSGGLGLFASLAYSAYRRAHGTRGKRLAPDQFLPHGAAEASKLNDAIIIAMVSSVRCRGPINPEERIAVLRRIQELGLTPSHRHLVDQVLLWSTEPSKAAALAETTEQAAMIYLASLALIGGKAPQEERYLRALRSQLGLDSLWAAELEKSADPIREIVRFSSQAHPTHPSESPFATLLCEPDIFEDRRQARV